MSKKSMSVERIIHSSSINARNLTFRVYDGAPKLKMSAVRFAHLLKIADLSAKVEILEDYLTSIHSNKPETVDEVLGDIEVLIADYGTALNQFILHNKKPVTIESIKIRTKNGAYDV